VQDMCQLANRIPRTLTITGFGVVGIPANSCQLCQPGGNVVDCFHATRCVSPSRQGWMSWHWLAELALVGWSANRLKPLIIKALRGMVGKLAQRSLSDNSHKWIPNRVRPPPV